MRKFALFLVLCVLFWGCAKKEVPVPAPKEEPKKELKEEKPKEAEEKKPEKEEVTEKEEVKEPKVVSAEEKEEVEEVESPPEFEEEEVKVPELSEEELWRLYGRSTPPLKAIFFDFDDYRIRKDMIGRLKENARYLLRHPHYVVELQGNCDERGERDYNLALGEKRALEVKKFLMNLGVSSDRLITVSFGEERPLAPGHNETAWAINRRVDLVIINKGEGNE